MQTVSDSTARIGTILLVAMTAQAAILAMMGQPAICTCGIVRLWHGTVLSAENSQQITDWYSFSHIIHGIVFYAGLRWLLPRAGLATLLLLAVVLEGTWEILENSPIVIDRYRQQALAEGYSGDSILNSLSDTLAMAAGFLLARRAPVTATVGFVVAAELFTLLMIRDNLTLNVLQLVAPSPTISAWQAEGQR